MNRIDAHQHFWHYTPEEYGWIDDSMSALRRDFLPEELETCLSSGGLSGCVAVQARQCLTETDWLLRLSERYAFIAGVVGWVDLRHPEVEQHLDRYSEHPKFVGVRHVVQDEPDPDFLFGHAFTRGIQEVAARNLSYDILIRPHQLGAAIRFANNFPEMRLILDHMAKPEIAGKKLRPWSLQIHELASCSNVWCKVSGMVTEAEKHWKQEDFVPYLDVVFEAFGCHRVMMGSDWPVCTSVAPYPQVLSIVKKYIKQFPENLQEQILGGNAADAYRLPGAITNTQ
jgi:L-fuconolactonase